MHLLIYISDVICTYICGIYEVKTPSAVGSYMYLKCHLSVFKRFVLFSACVP